MAKTSALFSFSIKINCSLGFGVQLVRNPCMVLETWTLEHESNHQELVGIYKIWFEIYKC